VVRWRRVIPNGISTTCTAEPYTSVTSAKRYGMLTGITLNRSLPLPEEREMITMNKLCAVCKDKCKQEDWVEIIKCPDFVHRKTGTSHRTGLSPKERTQVLGIQKTVTRKRVGRPLN